MSLDHVLKTHMITVLAKFDQYPRYNLRDHVQLLCILHSHGFRVGLINIGDKARGIYWLIFRQY